MSKSHRSDGMIRIDWQQVIFSERIRRNSLMSLSPLKCERELKISVTRNMPVEYALEPLRSFLSYAGYGMSIALSPYDDALSYQNELETAFDLKIVWLDFDRYLKSMSPGALVEWLLGRLKEMRAKSNAPILVLGAEPPLEDSFDFDLTQALLTLPGVRLVPRLHISKNLGPEYFDSRFEAIGATNRSDASWLALARELGLVWIPAAIAPRIKAIALDLDHTLYDGVLGEDGIDGVQLTPRRNKLQNTLLSLRNEGILLALISKNEIEDVERLFQLREDFPLRWEHFSALKVGWDAKGKGIVHVASALRIGVDSILFVDDNPGELAAIAMEHPDVSLLYAEDPNQAINGLKWHPGLLAWGHSRADDVRAVDLDANIDRERLASITSDPLEYIRSLDIQIVFALNRIDQIQRLAELSKKTNQFNLTLRRYTEIELSSGINTEGFYCASADLKDRLSDSGIIFEMVASVSSGQLEVLDLCISCRALGRGIEDYLIIGALRSIQEIDPFETVIFNHSTGPRNGPSRDWLTRFVGSTLKPSGKLEISWMNSSFSSRMEDVPIKFSWRGL